MAVNASEMLSDAERLQFLVDALGDHAIITLDRAGFVVSWNYGAQRITGYRSGEIIGQHFSRLFPAEDRDGAAPGGILREAEAAGRVEHEGWRMRKDGGRFWASSVIEAICGERGEPIGFAEVARDLTERRAAQDALRDSERQFRLLIESVVDYAIYMLDPSGVVASWNAGAQRLEGYAAGEIVGQHVSRFYIKEDRAAGLPLRLLEVAAREGRCEAEGWRLRKDGSRFWALETISAIRGENGGLSGFAKVTRDITERRAAQDALRDSERRFRLLVAGVTDCALYMLDPNGIVTNWNAGAARITGYMAGEIVGQHFSRFYMERDRLAGRPARALYTAAEEGRFEAEGWRVRKDGSLFWASVAIDPIRDEHGTPIGFAEITRDITERRAAQLALQKARDERDRAQKMEALGELTGSVAHDFNNVLMIVSGYLETLTGLVGADPKGRRAAEAIALAVERGEALTRQLLTFARRQALNPVVVEIGERIEAVRAMLASSFGASVRLAADLPPDLWPVTADVSEFELALVNIALNARDAMPEGGLVTISAENAQLAPGEVGQDIAGEFVALTIADTGRGIPEDILPRVFDPFFTTKGSQGTGLGLSQVYGFACQSGGTVTIDSRLGAGTRITLYLPRAAALPALPAADPAVEAYGSGTALVVEDNPDVAEVTTGLLQQLGFRTHVAIDAPAALAAAARQSFDLLLSDIVMPGLMDGLGLARILRQRHPALPIVLVTGYSGSAAGSKEFALLRKPYRLADLNRAVARAIAETRPSAPANLVHLRDVRRGQPG
ncbi:MAG TPA: PAS domain S-box protein [Stellaceae bacterium]|nr:PAS domain S-box protein [Stellaceae bacterium]